MLDYWKKLFQKLPLKSKLKSPLSVYKHYENEQGNLYDPRDTQEFAEKHSPGLKWSSWKPWQEIVLH